MALPTTIGENAGTQNSFHGPFISANGDVFTILIDDQTANDAEIIAFRATDPTDSFTESDSGNRPVMGSGSSIRVRVLNIDQVGDDLHVVTQNIDDDVFYARFDMSAASNVGSWDDVTTTGGDKDQLITSAANGAADACDLVVRTGQTDVLAVFQFTTEADMGTDFERIAFDTKADLTTGAWAGSPPYLGSNGMGVAIDVTGPRCVYEAVSGRTHVVYREDPGTDAIHHSSISSSDTETANGDIAESPAVRTTRLYAIGHGVLFDRGGTKKIRFPYQDDGDDLSIIEFNDAASPSYTFEAAVDGTNAIRAVNNSSVVCLAVDGSQVHEMHTRQTDSDLYTTDDADTDTWGTPTSTFIGNVIHISCNIYDRSGTKLAQIIDDGGTIKYDEDVLAVAPSGAGDQSVQPITQAGIGVMNPDGAGDQSIQPITQAGNGELKFEGVGDQSVQSVTQAGIGVMNPDGDGDQSVQPVTQAGVGQLEFVADGDQSVQPVTQAGVGVLKFEGAGDQSVQPVTQAGVGVMQPSGDGDQTVQSVTQAGVGEHVIAIDGAGDQSVQSVTQAGVGVMQPDGVGDQSVQPVTQAGVGELKFEGVGDQLLQSVTQAGVGVMNPDGAGDQSVQSVTQAGVGQLEFVGDGDQSVQPVTQAGIGVMNPDGNADQSVQPVTQAGNGELIFTADGDQSVQPITQAGNAVMQPDGAGDQSVQPITQAGLGVLIFIVTGDQSVAIITQAGVGNTSTVVDGAGDQSILVITQAGVGDVLGAERPIVKPILNQVLQPVLVSVLRNPT